MRLNQLVFWGLLLEQAVSQSKSANISERITESPILRKVILLHESEKEDRCTLEYREFKNSYLRFVNRPNYQDYITSYEGCFHKCCVENSFCKSFSYFPDTNQCFLMNVTRHDEGVVMAYSLIHLHVEMINPDHTATTAAQNSLMSFATTTAEITEKEGEERSYPPIIATTVPADIEINPTFTTGRLLHQTNMSRRSGHVVENPITIKAVDTSFSNNSFLTTASVWKFAQNSTTPMDETQSGDGKREPSDDVTFVDSTGNHVTSNERTSNVTQTETSSKPTESSFVTHRSVISKFTTIKPKLHIIKSTEMLTKPPISPESTLKRESSTVAITTSKYVQQKYDITTASIHMLSAHSHQASRPTVEPQQIVTSPTSSNSQQKNTPTNSQPTGSTPTSSKYSPPSAELHGSVRLRTTTFRYSPTLSRLTTSRSRPPATKSTLPTTKQSEKTKSKSASSGHIITRFVLKPNEKTNLQDQQRGLMDKLTSCGFECKNGGKCKIYRNIKRTLKCQCKDGFKGKFCEKVVVASRQGIFRITWWIILLIVVAIILFISVVATFFIFYIYKRKVGNYNLTKERRFELASAYSPDRIDQALGPHYASLAWQNRPAQSLRSTDDANKSWIFCYFDNEARCESIYRMRAST